MKGLGDYVHSKGLKFGIYSSPGPKTCGGYEGSYGHDQQDANTYASWGVDFLKYDLCSYMEIMKLHDPRQDPQKALVMMQAAYRKMHEALMNTRRPIVYGLCQYGVDSVWEWGSQVGGNMWRTTDDISDSYRSMALIGFSQPGLERFTGPGHWNDPDMLEIGNGGMTADQYRQPDEPMGDSGSSATRWQ
jgi:alpha-galactosidase